MNQADSQPRVGFYTQAGIPWGREQLLINDIHSRSRMENML